MKQKILTGCQANARIPLQEFNQIQKLVDMGFFINTADFVRGAIREKLQELEIVFIRDVDVKTAKKEILNYLKDNPIAYPSDIATELGLDLDVTMQAIKGLIEKKGIEVVE